MDETFGHYRIVEELGRGGMGVVYKAYEESLNRYVALKVLGEHLTQDSSFVARFVREAQSAASLHHPNVVQIFFIGEERGRHYFAMEWVEGRSLRDVIAERGRLPSEDAVELLMQAASGLGAAHERGVLHRDIKPANMMITEDGRLKIADFGLALPTDVATRLTASGALLGTPAYVSPEQCEGLQPDPRSDIYSLGLTFYEMLSGRVPFQADSPMGLLRQILQTEPPPIRELNADVDPRLEAILGRMMAKDREQRYGSCREILEDLEAYRRGEEPEARPAAPPPPPAVAPVVAEPTEQATIVLAEESALVPRGETLPAAPPVERGSRRGVLVAAIVVVLLLASVAAATVFVVGRQWISSRPDGETESLFGQVAQLAERTFGAGRSSGDAPTFDRARASTEAAAPLSGTTTSPDGSSGDPPATVEPPAAESSRGAGTSAGISSGASASLSDDARGQLLEAEPTSAPGARVSPPTPAPPTIAARVVEAGRAGERPVTARAEPPPSPPPPPLPARPRVSVVGSGEPLLAVAAEEWLQDELAQRGVDTVAEDSVPALSDLLREPLQVQDLLAALAHNGIHVVVLAEVDFVGERPLRYLGRSDRALNSRLRVNAFLTAEGRALWPGWSGEVEYTEINARRQAESSLLPAIADLMRGLDEGWEAVRRAR